MEDLIRFERGGSDMRRQLYFDYSPDENRYVIQEDGHDIFCIDGNTLKFVSLEFYNGVYAGKRSTAIDFENKIDSKSSDPLKKGQYIYNWIKEILISVEQELPEPEEIDKSDNENEDNDFDLIDEMQASHKNKKTVPLFDWPACAGDGFYFDQQNVPYETFETDKLNADYAVKISGRSMEPTIQDGSVVMAQQVDVLSNGDIGIFSVNGEIMCKRYCVCEGNIVLKPDNQSGDFCDIDVSKVECIIQGKVLL